MIRRRHTEFPPLNVSKDFKSLETDLRSICRESKRCFASVRLDFGWVEGHDRQVQVDWLKLGQVNITRQSDRDTGRFRLEAYLENATDVEHDSARCVRLPLIGLTLDPLAVHYHLTNFVAWVDPNVGDDEYDFAVPRPGYDPRKHSDAYVCKDKSCQEEDEDGKKQKSHYVVPQGFYSPPFDAELYKVVKGKRVEISIGPMRKGQ
jgi:hypothetical protein